MARAGFAEREQDNVYNGMTLREYARMSLTERGIGVSGITRCRWWGQRSPTARLTSVIFC